MHLSNYDVCVVGAGLSGLSAAAFVLRQQPALNLLVLEQATEPGGAGAPYHDGG